MPMPYTNVQTAEQTNVALNPYEWQYYNANMVSMSTWHQDTSLYYNTMHVITYNIPVVKLLLYLILSTPSLN